MAHYRNWIIVAIVALVIVVGTPAFSAKPAKPPQLIIQSVIVQANALQISGGNLDNGDTLTVTLAGTPLAVTSSDSNQIVASLSSTPPAGTYKLTVVTGTASTQSGDFYVTIGAVGIQGPKGDKGDPGPPGVGSLGGYDGSGLFLGFLTDASRTGYRIYNPDIPAFLNLSTIQNPPVFKQPCLYDKFGFLEDYCSGQIYAEIELTHSEGVYGCGLDDLIYNPHSGLYYVRDKTLPVRKHSDLKSVICIWSEGCRLDISTCGGLPNNTIFAIKEIQVPELLTTTLEYPIVVQPIQ